MKRYILKRRYFEHGTYSYLYRQDGSKVCCMVEPVWKNNKPFESCIPEGDYDWLPHISPKYGECYVLSAPNLGVTVYEEPKSIRFACLTHIANKPSQLVGCNAPGLDFGFLGGEWSVSNSGDAFHMLMRELDGEPARLTIMKD